MQLTKHTDYAFRVLIYLAKNENGMLCSIQDIASQYDISKNHLMKIVQNLVSHGIVESVRGAQGGIRLARAPRDINIRTIVEITEVTLQPTNCEQSMCCLRKSCQLRSILFMAQEAYLAHLAQFSLQDISQNAEFSYVRLR